MVYNRVYEPGLCESNVVKDNLCPSGLPQEI